MTTRTVWVLRHAKAAQGDLDHERPLTGRGERQARELGRHLASVHPGGEGATSPTLPTTVLCSSARRALQTAQLVMAGAFPEAALLVERALYQADADDVVGRLQELPDDDAAVMVVGHNPTLHDLVLVLLDASDAAARRRLDDAGFPTAALAVLSVPAPSWGRLGPGTGTLVDLWTPRRPPPH